MLKSLPFPKMLYFLGKDRISPNIGMRVAGSKLLKWYLHNARPSKQELAEVQDAIAVALSLEIQ